MNSLPISFGSQEVLLLGAIACGMLYCFLGYRLFRFVLGLTGFILAGAVAALLVGWISFANPLAVLIALLIGGICGAMALFFLYRAGVFCLGGLAALLLAYSALHESQASWAPWAIVGLAALGGLLALLLERPAMTLATAALGAWLAAYAVATLLAGGGAAPSLGEGSSGLGLEWWGLAGWVVLTLLGALFQFRAGRRRQPAGPPALA
jgi:hypothetical protein